MKIENPASEPSMDEILASIRHIISGDSQNGATPHLASSNDEDILDLTDILPEEGQKMENSGDTKKNDPKLTTAVRKDEALPSLKEFPEKTKAANYSAEPLVSQSTVSEAAIALQSLNKFASESTFRSDPRLNDGMGGQTVENLVREILRPLLKEWLDANLPTLVRWVVNEQVERIVRQVNAAQHESVVEKERSSVRHPGI
ncbi:MAG TPA: DUF2497 domain-containing protein [Alphaproteobacteria bacterium]|nr:DUF2497 domain-containing protein [Alphaproteobacteria bacterium]